MNLKFKLRKGLISKSFEELEKQIMEIEMDKSNVADSGERRVEDTGAQRDRHTGKGRMDLLPMRALMKLAELYEAGAIKYDARNWEKGLPLSSFLDSGMRHLGNFAINKDDEPHLVQAAWNMMCLLDTVLRIKDGTLPLKLNDLGINIDTMVEVFSPVQATTPVPTEEI